MYTRFEKQMTHMIYVLIKHDPWPVSKLQIYIVHDFVMSIRKIAQNIGSQSDQCGTQYFIWICNEY